MLQVYFKESVYLSLSYSSAQTPTVVFFLIAISARISMEESTQPEVFPSPTIAAAELPGYIYYRPGITSFFGSGRKDKPNVKVRKGREVWEKYIQMCNSKNNPQLWNSKSLIYGVYKPPDDASNNGEGARTRIEFFPEMNEGILIDDEGVSGESILEKAAQGNFTQVMKLKDLHQNTPAGEFPIERIMATLWNSTCEPMKRKLIHWVAYHNQLEILDWMLHSSSIFLSKNPYELEDEDPYSEEDDEEADEDLQQNKADRLVSEGDKQAEVDISQIKEDDKQVEQNNQPILEGSQRVRIQSGSQRMSVGAGLHSTYRKDANYAYGFLPIKAKDSLNAQDLYGFTPLHLATIENHEGIVKRLFAKEYDSLLEVHIAAENMLASEGTTGKSNKLTPLHFAARNKSSLPIVQMLLEKTETGRDWFKGGSIIERKSSSGKTALHYACQNGNWEVVKQLLEVSMVLIPEGSQSEYVNDRDVFRRTPLYHAASNNHVEVVEILLRDVDGLNVNTVTWEGISALDIAKRNEDKQSSHKDEKKVIQRIVDMLESYDVNWLISERQKYASAASFLLVGAALIAGVTYAGWLQPPLGLTQYYDFPASNFVAPPETYDSYVGVEQHWEIQTFWVFNSMAFFCSMATFIFGAAAGIPKKCASLREEVVQLRKSVVRASFVLAVAILFAIGAFASAGIIVLPPIARQRAPTYATVAVGVVVCMKFLMEFILKLWIWFRSPSLVFKMEEQDRSSKLYTSGSRWAPKYYRFELPVDHAINVHTT